MIFLDLGKPYISRRIAELLAVVHVQQPCLKDRSPILFRTLDAWTAKLLSLVIQILHECVVIYYPHTGYHYKCIQESVSSSIFLNIKHFLDRLSGK